ncbi:MAG: NAD kinase [Phyllobacteriaceae bacterium]|nr:NAD kinase [Phyllobacteriaceae bacterium]
MKIAFVASRSKEALEGLKRLEKRYGNVTPAEADYIVALGGDGFMLATQHRFMNSGTGVYGMNKGTVGFLMNEYREDDLEERLAAAAESVIQPLVMDAVDMDGRRYRHKAINEVSLLRQSYQAASLRIAIDGKVRLENLVGDGVLVATPAGSTAYNLSAHGPILPLDAPLLALTPISPFRPRRWRGALIPSKSVVEIDINEAEKRPVNAVADHFEVKSVTKVTVREDRESKGIILFDPDHSWDERILAEQFQY